MSVFRNYEGEAVKIPVVKKMEIRMANDDSLNKDYLPIIGRECFCNAGIRLLLGSEHPAYLSKTVYMVQHFNPIFRPVVFKRSVVQEPFFWQLDSLIASLVTRQPIFQSPVGVCLSITII